MTRFAAPRAARYAIGPLELDADRLVLSRAGEPLALGPRVVGTLAALVERAGEVTTKDEILDAVWSGEDVGESNVAQSVYTLRKVLREHGLGDAIATVQRRGYRFTAPVEQLKKTVVADVPLPHAGAGAGTASRWAASRWLTAALSVALVFLAAVPAPRAVPHAPPLSARGAELYQLGRYYWNLRTAAGLAKSRTLFAAVVASDPCSPLGYTGLADADLMTVNYRQEAAHDHVGAARYFARARAEIAKALALDRNSAAAHASAGMLHSAADRDKRAAEAEFRRAIALDPSYAVAHHWYGTTLFGQGRLAEASRELRTAMSLEPVAAATDVWLAETAYYQRRYADAIAYSRRALDLDPRRFDALRRLGLAYELAGDLPRAIAVFKQLRESGFEPDDASALLAEAYARSGRPEAARAALLRARRAGEGNTAMAMLALGERARGLSLIGAMRKKYGAPTLLDPRFEPYRNEVGPLAGSSS
ncbi:MAG: transcriptional regulator, CadC [Candidatus Eremiobacteraeota bacterium]|nr:transcriptional regulator, CadC [Candidatus Eremiobacteraeota bacterium]